MRTRDDDNQGPVAGKPPTMIVPGGNLDAVASRADRKNASYDPEAKPAVDNSSFDAQRIMAPGGDLDAIDLHAEIMGKRERSGKPAGTAASLRPLPAVGDEKNMMFRDRGIFVDSAPDENESRGPRYDARTGHGREESAWPVETSGFRFRDGADDDFPRPSDNFHDGVAPPVQNIPSRTSEIQPPDRSPALNDAPRQRNDDATASGDDTAACLDVSTAQLEAVIHRIMERVFVKKIEAMLKEVLEKAVEKEMRNFRSLLEKGMEKPGEFMEDRAR